MLLAHIAGVPVEETALSLAPVLVVPSGIAASRLRQLTVVRKCRDLRLATKARPDQDCGLGRREAGLFPPVPGARRGQPTVSGFEE